MDRHEELEEQLRRAIVENAMWPYEPGPDVETATQRCQRWARIHRARAAAAELDSLREQHLRQARWYDAQAAADGGDDGQA